MSLHGAHASVHSSSYGVFGFLAKDFLLEKFSYLRLHSHWLVNLVNLAILLAFYKHTFDAEICEQSRISFGVFSANEFLNFSVLLSSLSFISSRTWKDL